VQIDRAISLPAKKQAEESKIVLSIVSQYMIYLALSNNFSFVEFTEGFTKAKTGRGRRAKSSAISPTQDYEVRCVLQGKGQPRTSSECSSPNP
jgi:hypothetical protein